MSKSSKTDAKPIRGISIRTFNNTFLVLSCILYVILFAVTVFISAMYNQFVQDADHYLNCMSKASDMQEASDYLTAQVLCRARTQTM